MMQKNDILNLIKNIRAEIDASLFIHENIDHDNRINDVNSIKENIYKNEYCDYCTMDQFLNHETFFDAIMPNNNLINDALDFEFSPNKDISISNMQVAKQRVSSIIDETRHVLYTKTTQFILQESFDYLYDVLIKQCTTIFDTNEKQLPFVKVIIPYLKQYDTFTDTDASHIQYLYSMDIIKKLCSIIYLPLYDTLYLEKNPKISENANNSQIPSELKELIALIDDSQVS